MDDIWQNFAGFAAYAGLPDWKFIAFHWQFYAAIALGAYILGSIPFGLLLTKLTGRGDIRTIGSGNIGATNVLRTGSKVLAATTLLFDIGKGAAAVLLARSIAGPDGVIIAGLAAFLGHLYPVWLKFSGGKGVATMIGIHLAVAWPIGVAAICVWLLTAIIFRFSSAAALVASVAAPIAAMIMVGAQATTLAIFLTIFVWIKHASNIRRLLHGTEPKIKLK